MIEQLQLLVRSLPLTLGRSLDTTPLRILELSQIGNNPLPRPTLGSIRLDQRPVGVSLAVLPPIAWPDKHARILNTKRLQSSRKVFTTSRFNSHHIKNRSLSANPGKLHPTSDPVRKQNILGKTNSGPELAKLG